MNNTFILSLCFMIFGFFSYFLFDTSVHFLYLSISICRDMFIAAFFIIVKNWKQSEYQLIAKLKNKLQYIYTMLCYMYICYTPWNKTWDKPTNVGHQVNKKYLFSFLSISWLIVDTYVVLIDSHLSFIFLL